MSERPSILENLPGYPGTLRQQSFHGEKVMIWEGKTKISNVKGWTENPRIQLEAKRFQKAHFRPPTEAEIFAIMKAMKDVFRLAELAEDIRRNGVRQPIILTSTGKLLDGNRRFFASKLLLENLDAGSPEHVQAQLIPVWILDPSHGEDIEQLILVQENFYQAFKLEWPDFVKAQMVLLDHEGGVPVQTLAQKYSWTKTKVQETVRIMKLIMEFVEFATADPGEEGEELGLGMDELEAERIAAEQFQNFNEAQKSLKAHLEKDWEFKRNFFVWIAGKKFKSWQEVRIAHDAWIDPDAKQHLLKPGPDAAKHAKAVIEYKKAGLQDQAKVSDKIAGFIGFLGGLTTDQKASLTHEDLEGLTKAVQLVIKMAEAQRSTEGAGA